MKNEQITKSNNTNKPKNKRRSKSLKEKDRLKNLAKPNHFGIRYSVETEMHQSQRRLLVQPRDRRYQNQLRAKPNLKIKKGPKTNLQNHHV